MRVVTFKASEEFINLLENYALQAGVSRAEVIRRAVIDFMNRYPPTVLSNIDKPVTKPRIRRVSLV